MMITLSVQTVQNIVDLLDVELARPEVGKMVRFLEKKIGEKVKS